MKVDFDEEGWTHVSVSKTDMSNDFLLAHGSKESRLTVALAGAVAATGDGEWIVVRFRRTSATASSADIRVTLFEFNEPGQVTDVAETEEAIPTVFALQQNYPNPFNPSTVIRYDLPHASTVSVRVYDMLGRMVTSLAEGNQDAGAYSVAWDGTSAFGHRLSSGIYFVTMTAQAVEGQEFRSVKKMILTK
jgi:hypothetical protein